MRGAGSSAAADAPTHQDEVVAKALVLFEGEGALLRRHGRSADGERPLRAAGGAAGSRGPLLKTPHACRLHSHCCWGLGGREGAGAGHDDLLQA